MPRTLAPWKSRVGSLAWLAVPICSVVNGIAIYYLEVSIIHSGRTFALWAAVLTGLFFLVFFVIWALTESFFPAYVSYALPLTIVLLVSAYRYGFRYQHAGWWVQYLLGHDSPGPLLVAAISGVVYLLIMSLLLLIELSGRFAGAAVILGSTTILRWALHNKARPLRWVALIFFLIGFHFDLLAT